MKVAISGFGRIGKSFLKAAIKQNALGRDFDVVAINTRSPVENHVHLFRYDSVYGRFPGTVEAKGGNFVVAGYPIKWISEPDPARLPWKEMGIDLVLESTGKFRTGEDCRKHLEAGAKKVLISAPGKGEISATIVPGVNEQELSRDTDTFSLASCTTNCLAPLLKVMENEFGIKSGFMSTIHAYTNDQNIVDGSHRDLRRARAGAVNIIPTTTGAARAIGAVIPSLEGKMDGLAYRVPVPDGSLTDITLLLKREAAAEEINSRLKQAAEGKLKGILGYTDEPIVSTDIIGNPLSSIVDGSLTKAKGRLAKVASWYDNEYGYSCRLVDFVRLLAGAK
ncbi:type I glyceraldehyde-3-phosphate dehydrogenase [Candidatus Micrarchaeota archaeon]|nr:type I glyceraldehyde-3-phosphate dehydrogenase [Candidatus Micrarchaeota archaeon]